jgi:hypothetical protein
MSVGEFLHGELPAAMDFLGEACIGRDESVDGD